MNALAHGASVVTDGPLAWFEVDGDARFDTEKLRFRAEVSPGTENRDFSADGKIGGAGDWDGGHTVLVTADAAPVIRYTYANNDEFGAPSGNTTLGRISARDGSIAKILLHYDAPRDRLHAHELTAC